MLAAIDDDAADTVRRAGRPRCTAPIPSFGSTGSGRTPSVLGCEAAAAEAENLELRRKLELAERKAAITSASATPPTASLPDSEH